MDVSLSCNAQGHPPPVSRYEIITLLSINTRKCHRERGNQRILIKAIIFLFLEKSY